MTLSELPFFVLHTYFLVSTNTHTLTLAFSPPQLSRSRATSTSTHQTNNRECIENAPEGRVPNISQWLTWSDKSLLELSEDGKGGIYDRINSMLDGSSPSDLTSSSIINTPEQIHESDRFAVLSHGNQTDPIYNYVNTAGFEVFRWPEEMYYKLPSRYSAPEGSNREVRANVVQQTVAKDVTYIDEAIRVRYPNATVTLREAILWNVYDDEGYRVGQTVLFDKLKCSYSDEE